MKTRHLVLMLAAAVCVQPAFSQTKPTAVANGVFVGRSGKPMAKTRVLLGQVAEDGETLYAWLKMPANLPSAVTDEKGQFQLKGFAPGAYAIVYVPPGGPSVLPAQISIKSLTAVTASMLPMMKGELPRADADKPWGKQYVLLKGHSFYSEGPNMKIWNATVRKVPNGPYFEVRKGLIWLFRLEDKSQIKYDAWSF